MATNFIDGVTVVTADFLNDLFGDNGHVHDGQDQDGSAPKVSLEDHVDYDGDGDGTEQGFIRVETDTSALHEIQHHHAGTGSSGWVSDILTAVTSVVTDALEPQSSTYVTVEDGAGNKGRLDARELTARWLGSGDDAVKIETTPNANNNGGALDLGALRSAIVTQSAGAIEVTNADGSARGDLQARAYLAEALRSFNDGEGSGIPETIEVIDSDGNVGEVALRIDYLKSDVFDFQNAVGQSGQGRPYLNAIRSADQSAGRNEMALEDNGANYLGNVSLWATNTFKAFAHVRGTDGSVTLSGQPFGVAGATYISQGVYDVTLAKNAQSADDIVATVTPASPGVVASVQGQSANEVRVTLQDTSGASVEGNVHLHVAHPGTDEEQP